MGKMAKVVNIDVYRRKAERKAIADQKALGRAASKHARRVSRDLLKIVRAM